MAEAPDPRTTPRGLRAPVRPGSGSASSAVIFVALYAACSSAVTPRPKLGLDLQGGTSVTLKPKLVDANGKPLDQKVSTGAINQAVDIIRQRVNGLGCREAEVVRAGTNIEISVPGKGRQQVVDLVGQTAPAGIPHPVPPRPTRPTTPPSTPSAAPSSTPSPPTASPVTTPIPVCDARRSCSATGAPSARRPVARSSGTLSAPSAARVPGAAGGERVHPAPPRPRLPPARAPSAAGAVHRA